MVPVAQRWVDHWFGVMTAGQAHVITYIEWPGMVRDLILVVVGTEAGAQRIPDLGGDPVS
jgi:hypothetical protein